MLEIRYALAIPKNIAKKNVECEICFLKCMCFCLARQEIPPSPSAFLPRRPFYAILPCTWFFRGKLGWYHCCVGVLCVEYSVKSVTKETKSEVVLDFEALLCLTSLNQKHSLRSSSKTVFHGRAMQGRTLCFPLLRVTFQEEALHYRHVFKCCILATNQTVLYFSSQTAHRCVFKALQKQWAQHCWITVTLMMLLLCSFWLHFLLQC